MKLAKEEMHKELLKDIEKLRLEVRQTLQNQMSFIEETYIDTKGMQKANHDLILDYNFKFENILSSVQSKVVNQELNREQQSHLIQNAKVLMEQFHPVVQRGVHANRFSGFSNLNAGGNDLGVVGAD